jgi:phage terminase large subunit-like protein
MTKAAGRKASSPSTSPDKDPVGWYAEAVLSGFIVAGPLVRAAGKRHLTDLVEGPKRGLVWRPDKALRAIEFFADVLCLADGEHAGKPFILGPWQKFIVGSIFGWYNADGTRRFRVAYVEVGKGNGKSPLGAGIGLYMLVADGEEGAEVYAAAVVKDQAKIQYRDAVNMVDQSEDLQEVLEKHGDKEVYNLVNRGSRGFFKPISSEKRGLDGKRVHCALVDELHEHPSAVVVDKMRAGTKGRRNALIFEITNSGFDRTTVCYQHHDYSARIVTGQQQDDSWFAFVCSLDLVKVKRNGKMVEELEDPFADEVCWIKANPNLGVSIQPRYLREQVREARGMPAKASGVKRLNFCIWVEAENPAVDQDVWHAAQATFAYADLVGIEPIGALDLSGVRDLTALGIWWPGQNGKPAHAAVEFWTPAVGLKERSVRDRVPWDLWVEQGFITATPGRAVDYAWVATRMGELQQLIGLRRVAFDAYRIKYLERELEQLAIEIELIPHGQGFYKSKDSGLWMPRSIELLEACLTDGTAKVLKSPPLTFNAASAVMESDAKDNRVYTKKRSRGRIDGLVTLAMCAGLASADKGPDVPAGYVPAFI